MSAVAKSAAICFALLVTPLALARDIVINYMPGGLISASAASQPQLSAVAYDAGGSVIRYNGDIVTFDAYIDTGSSGNVISNLTAVGFSSSDEWGDPTFVPGLGLDGSPAGEFIGHYTDYGIGGPEVGDVTMPIGLRVRSGVPLAATITYDDWGFPIVTPPVVNLAEFTDMGQHNLWVRRQPGYGERVEFMGIEVQTEPMNIAGMPVIRQSKMVMDPLSMAVDEWGNVTPMATYLVPKSDPGPATNMHFRLRLQDFVSTPPAGEVAPTHASNPVFDGVTISQTTGGVTRTSTGNTWLFDTGSGSTMIGFAKAKAIGLIDNSYATFADFMAGFNGIVLPIGGIGSITEPAYAPLMTVDEIRVPDARGNTVVWKNVDVLILDVAGLDGVFGLNLVMPSSTLDVSTGLPTEVSNSPGYFDKIVFNTLDNNWADLTLLYSPGLAGDATGDGVVNFSDYLVLEQNFNTDGQFDHGDFTADGRINFSDYLVLEQHFGDRQTVPEPATLLILLAGTAMIRRR